MKQIILQQLRISNFKGIKSLTIDFNRDITSIFADNGLGKTTILDAFIWLFFNKDSQDRKEFDIKNTKFPELNRGEHEVSATISIDHVTVELKHVYKEKWQKKKGAEFAELTGHEHLFFWNEVPVSQAEYKDKIEAYIIDEETFKLVAISGYFTSLNWKKQRAILIGMADNVTDLDLASENEEFHALAEPLSVNSLEEYKKIIALNKKKVKGELDHIPARIDEVQRGVPEILDWPAIEAEIKAKNSALQGVERSMSDAYEAYNEQFETVKAHQANINSAKLEEQNIANAIKLEQSKKENGKAIEAKRLQDILNGIGTDIKSKESLLTSKENYLKTKRQYAGDLQVRLENMRNLWADTNAKELVFNQHEFNCPTCMRALDQDDIDAKKDELIKNFNADKQRALADIVAKADDVKSTNETNKKEIEETENTISSLHNTIETLRGERTKAENDLSDYKASLSSPINVTELIDSNVEIIAIREKIANLESSIPALEKPDTSAQEDYKQSILTELDGLKTLLSYRDQINTANKRISELKDDERRYSQELAKLEGTEFLIAQFTRYKMDRIEGSINGKFETVKFKMFDQQVNGAEVETCEAMVDGVPFSVLNNAARINAGIDIINCLSENYGITAPIFIDNAESITQIIDTPSQLVRLVVSEMDKSLRVA